MLHHPLFDGVAFFKIQPYFGCSDTMIRMSHVTYMKESSRQLQVSHVIYQIFGLFSDLALFRLHTEMIRMSHVTHVSETCHQLQVSHVIHQIFWPSLRSSSISAAHVYTQMRRVKQTSP